MDFCRMQLEHLQVHTLQIIITKAQAGGGARWAVLRISVWTLARSACLRMPRRRVPIGISPVAFAFRMLTIGFCVSWQVALVGSNANNSVNTGTFYMNANNTSSNA